MGDYDTYMYLLNKYTKEIEEYIEILDIPIDDYVSVVEVAKMLEYEPEHEELVYILISNKLLERSNDN